MGRQGDKKGKKMGRFPILPPETGIFLLLFPKMPNNFFITKYALQMPVMAIFYPIINFPKKYLDFYLEYSI